MDDESDLIPRDLKDDIEVIYLDEEEDVDDIAVKLDINEIEEYPPEEENNEDAIETEIIDLSKLTFTRHCRSIFCGDISPDGLFAVTGGEDDMAYVWSVMFGEIYLECTGHKDSVTEVGFNRDGQYVVTADMSGLVQVWSMKEKKLIWCYESDELEWLFWHPLANVVLAGCHSGDVYIWQVPQGNCKILASHGVSSTCAKILSDGKRLVVGYDDGQVKLWDIKEAVVMWQLAQPLPSGVTSLDVNSDDTLAILAPSSQIIKISDGKPVEVLLMEDESDVECVSFNKDQGIIVTGALSGKLCVWDIAKKTIRHQAKIDSSVTALKWGPNGKLFAGATDGAVYVCDAKVGTLIETLTGHKATILSLTVSGDGKTVLTTSDDGDAKIFAIKDS